MSCDPGYAITKEREFFLVGSQAAHLQLDQMPDVMQMSGELDIYPRRKPELSDLIDDAIGEGSMFHETFGYYAHGIGPETAKLPIGWEERAIRISAPGMDKAVAIAPKSGSEAPRKCYILGQHAQEIARPLSPSNRSGIPIAIRPGQRKPGQIS